MRHNIIMIEPFPARGQLDVLFARCRGAYSDMTLRGYRNDLEVFRSWCERKHQSWLPANPLTVASFIDEEALGKAVSTVKRRVSAIQFAHRMADLASPVGHSEVQLALRRAGRAKRRRPAQALGLTAEMLSRLVDACPSTLAGLRDAALFSVGYDTLCRSSELVAMRVENISDDFGSIRIPRSKSDQFGDGRIAYLSPATIGRLDAWLGAAGFKTGALFRGLHTQRVSKAPLDTSSIRRRIKKGAKRAGFPPAVVAGLSGHSMRVGAAQDMMVSGLDTLGIMQAGGWRTYNVLSRYVENASAAKLHERRWQILSTGPCRTDPCN